MQKWNYLRSTNNLLHGFQNITHCSRATLSSEIWYIIWKKGNIEYKILSERMDWTIPGKSNSSQSLIVLQDNAVVDQLYPSTHTHWQKPRHHTLQEKSTKYIVSLAIQYLVVLTWHVVDPAGPQTHLSVTSQVKQCYFRDKNII